MTNGSLMKVESIAECSHWHALKGTATLKISMFYQKEHFESWILKQVSSKWNEKNGEVMGI